MRRLRTPAVALASVGVDPPVPTAELPGLKVGSASLRPARLPPALWPGVSRPRGVTRLLAWDQRLRALVARVHLEYLRPFAPAGRDLRRGSARFGPLGRVARDFILGVGQLQIELRQ